MAIHVGFSKDITSSFNPYPAEPGYTLPLQTSVDPDHLASEEAN